MDTDTIRELLLQNKYIIREEKRLTNNSGTQLKLENGAKINIFNTGTIQVQGKAEIIDPIQRLLDTPGKSKKKSNRVFVAYGHDETAKKELEVMLRRWGLDPLFLDQLPSEGQTIIEKIERYITEEVGFAVVLATPDDEGYRKSHPDEKSYRTRQNVVLELGMLLSKLGRKRVAILLRQSEAMERPSDIQGLIYIPFKDDLQKEAGPLLAKEMFERGFRIEISKL